MVGIYKITSPTGKVYIGQSWDIVSRKSYYRCGASSSQVKIYRSLKKHGFENHKWEVIHELPKDITQIILDDYEALYMSLYKSIGAELLNIREAGSRGKHSEETRLKMKDNNGKQMLGKKLSEATKIKIGAASKGNKHALGYKHSEEALRKISETSKIKGRGLNIKRHSEEAKQIISQRMKGNTYGLGKKWTPEQRELMKNRKTWNKGIKGAQSHTDEWKEIASKRMSGENHPMNKISDQQLASIRLRYQLGESAKNLAEEFNINYSHCVKLVTNKIRVLCVQ